MNLAAMQAQIDALKKTQFVGVTNPASTNGIIRNIGCGMTNSAKTGWTTSDTYEAMTWDTSSVKGRGTLAIGSSAGIIIKDKGDYLLLATVFVTAANDNSDAYSKFTKNGTNLGFTGTAWANAEIAAGGSNYGGYSLIGMASLESGDVIGVSLSPQGATTLTTPAGNSSLVVVRIS